MKLRVRRSDGEWVVQCDMGKVGATGTSTSLWRAFRLGTRGMWKYR